MNKLTDESRNRIKHHFPEEPVANLFPPDKLIGDKAYDSDPLDEELAEGGIEMIAPHQRNRVKPATQDRRKLRRYQRRWLVERFFAWIQWQRHTLVRWEYYAANFPGFVQLTTVNVLLKQF